MRRTHYLLTAVVLAEVLVLAGCCDLPKLLGLPSRRRAGTAPADPAVKAWARRAGDNMDAVARGLEEFGTISVSSPLLAPAAKFDFAVDAGPNDYYKEAKSQVQGRVAVSDQFAQQTSVGVRAQGDLGTLLAALDAQAAYREELGDYETKRRLARHAARLRAQQVIDALPPGATPAERAAAEERAARILLEETPGSATTRPSYPTTAPTTLPSTDADLLPAPDKALAVLNGAQFTAIRGLLGSDSSAVLQNRAALNIAAGDTATEAIFSLLGNPTGYIGFKDKRILFGAGMVGVSPGWRTKSGFAADVSVTAEFMYLPARREYRDAWLNYATATQERRADPELANLAKWLRDVRTPKPTTQPAGDGSVTISDGWLDEAPAPAGAGAAGTSTTGGGTNPGGATSATAGAATRATTSGATRTADPPASNPSAPLVPGQPAAPANSGVRRLDPPNEEPRQCPEGKDSGRDPTGAAGDLRRVVYAADGIQIKGGAGPGLISLPGVKASSGSGGSGMPSTPAVRPAMDIDPRFRLPDQPPSPLVAAVSPMTDSEVLDLTSSVRQQRAFALAASLALQYAGLKGQAAVFDQWAKRLEKDVVTRGASAAVSTYSHSGGMFGFQIGPRLRAVGAGGTANRPELVLERQSFPVLVVLGMDEADLEPRFALVGDQLTAFEPVLVFTQTTRWLPMTQPRGVERHRDDALRVTDPTRYEQVLNYSGLQRGVRERERIEWAVGLDDALAGAPWTSAQRRDALARLDDALYGVEPLLKGGVNRVPLTHKQRLGLQTAEELLGTPAAEAAVAQVKLDEICAGKTGKDRDKCSQSDAAKTEVSKAKGALRRARDELARANRNLGDGQAAALGSKAIDWMNKTLRRLLESADAHAVSDGTALQATRGRVNVLSYHAIGSSNWQYLPIDAVLNTSKDEKAPGKLVINNAGTLHGYRRGVSHFVITGQNMNGHVAGVTVTPLGRNSVKGFTVLDGATVVRVEVDDNTNPGAAGLDLFLADDKGNATLAAHLLFDVPPPAPDDPGLNVEYDEFGRPTRVTVNGQAIVLSPAELVQLIQAVRKSDGGFRFGAEASGGFRVEVDGAAAPPAGGAPAAPAPPTTGTPAPPAPPSAGGPQRLNDRRGVSISRSPDGKAYTLTPDDGQSLTPAERSKFTFYMADGFTTPARDQDPLRNAMRLDASGKAFTVAADVLKGVRGVQFVR